VSRPVPRARRVSASCPTTFGKSFSKSDNESASNTDRCRRMIQGHAVREVVPVADTVDDCPLLIPYLHTDTHTDTGLPETGVTIDLFKLFP
jgi:hypothetical protein